MRFINLLNCLLLIICAIQLVPAQSGKQEGLESVKNQIEKNKFSGSVLLAEKGEVLLSEGYGWGNREKGIKNTSSTVFSTGSITKQFTAAAILKLETQGKLSVKDPIHQYFENVPEKLSEVSLHHLLTHSAGFPGAVGNDYDRISREEFLQKAFEANKYKAGPPQFEYSNVGYSLLAMIIEDVSKQSYEEYLRKQFFDPVGMELTGYLLPDWDDEQIATGYEGKKNWGQMHKKGWKTDGVSWHLKGNGGILSTVEDLYKWDQALLGEDILTAESKSKYFYPHVAEYDDGSSYYGYGWVILKTRRNTSLITHNGGNGVFFADMLRFVEDGTTIIIMSNSADRKTEDLAWEIASDWFN